MITHKLLQTKLLSSKLIFNCLLDIYTSAADIYSSSSETESTQLLKPETWMPSPFSFFLNPSLSPTLKPIHHKLCCLSCICYHHFSSSRVPSTSPWTSALGSLYLFLFLPNKPITFKTKIRTCVSPSAYLSNLIPLIPLSHHLPCSTL